MNDLLCSLLGLSVDIMQAIYNFVFGFGTLFGISPPNLRDSFGSIFGCNL